MKRVSSLIFAGLSVVLLLAAPSGCADRGALVNRDPWLAPSPAGTAAPEASARLDRSIVRLVLEPEVETAEELLTGRSWVRITPEEATRLAGWTNAPSGPEGELYLVRGVATLHPADQGVDVYRLSGNDLRVVFGAPADTTRQLVKQPLVVWLEAPPRNVYIEAGLAG